MTKATVMTQKLTIIVLLFTAWHGNVACQGDECELGVAVP